MASERALVGLFVCEGSSDAPLTDLVVQLFLDRHVDLHLHKPALHLLRNGSGSTLEEKLQMGLRLVDGPVDVIVIHRDSDNVGPEARRREMRDALRRVRNEASLLAIIPVRMTEAWLLLDERAIRTVAGNPNGRQPLNLPAPGEVERRANPKGVLKQALLDASGTTGRRRTRTSGRFGSHRRNLLEGLDRFGPVTGLESFQDLVTGVEEVVSGLE